jgi:hypothetical protein
LSKLFQIGLNLLIYQIRKKLVSNHKKLKFFQNLTIYCISFKAQRAQGKTEATVEAEGHEEGS